MTPRRILSAPFGRRAWAELAYALVTAVLALPGLAYVLLTVALGTALSVTAAGIPLLAEGVHGARGLGALHRAIARRFLGEHVAAPAPLRPGRGLSGRMATRLADGSAWRAMAYLALQVPLALVRLYTIAFTWGWGLVLLTHPVQSAMGENPLPFLRGPYEAVTPVAGAALLLVAPWPLHLTVLAERPVRRWLLGPRDLSERLQDLEETRARAVDDAAALLRRIERDLHDGAQVRLVALTMQLAMVRETVPDGAARALVDKAQATAREAIAELRELARGIHPAALDQGLEAALATLSARSPLPVAVHAGIGVRPTPAIESIAYFCAAELLANAAKHSGAASVRIDAVRDGDRLLLRVRDDGRGGATARAGSGLRGLMERVRTVDGRLEIDSPSGGPTVVTVDLPTHA